MKEFDKYPELVTQVENVVKEQGLNVLFNSAGISPRSSFLGLKALKPNELMDVYAVNCVAPLMMTKAFVPLLKKASDANKSAPLGVQRAAIVNMSKIIIFKEKNEEAIELFVSGSILGSVASNKEGSLYHYRLTKTGLNAATKSLSIDLKNDGIIAVNMHPGWVKTDMGNKLKVATI